MNRFSFKEEDGMGQLMQGPMGMENRDLREQEEQVFHCSGEGLLPGLTRAFRAPAIASRRALPDCQ